MKAKVPPAHVSIKPRVVESTEMDVVTQQLSDVLHIVDIDTADADNPQLCSEYVKEIYVYMRELEVRNPLPTIFTPIKALELINYCSGWRLILGSKKLPWLTTAPRIEFVPTS